MRFRSDPAGLRGSIAPVVTPFTDVGELDTEGLRRLISWQLDSGSHGISLGGSTGCIRSANAGGKPTRPGSASGHHEIPRRPG